MYFAPALVALGTIGIIYGAIAATMQKDLKRLVAYSSVAHLGFIVIGTFALNTEGLSGSLLQMVNHGISTGAVLARRLDLRPSPHPSDRRARWPPEAGAGLRRRLHGRDVELDRSARPQRLRRGVPRTARCLRGASLVGDRRRHGVIIAALYLLWAYQRVFHGPAEGDNAEMKDLTWSEGAIMVPFLAAIFVMGLYPAPVLERMEPAVDALIEHIEGNVEDFDEADADQGGPRRRRPEGSRQEEGLEGH